MTRDETPALPSVGSAARSIINERLTDDPFDQSFSCQSRHSTHRPHLIPLVLDPEGTYYPRTPASYSAPSRAMSQQLEAIEPTQASQAIRMPPPAPHRAGSVDVKMGQLPVRFWP